MHKDHFVVYKEFVLSLIASKTNEHVLDTNALDTTDGDPNNTASPAASANADSIATAIGALISTGQLKPGDKLPTVRALASELGVSANTVSDAWRILLTYGAISTDRRRGTTVRAPRSSAAGRYWQVPVRPGTIELDLSTGTPDPALLPPLGPVLGQLPTDLTVTSYVDPPVLPELEAELRRRLPFDPQAVTVVDGAQDALDRTVSAVVRLGDVVVVEDPTFPPLLDMLELAGAVIVGVRLDDEGPALTDLRDALAKQPKAVFLQPRAHNPTGVHISRKRAKAIAKLVGASSALVVEDDHSGEASGVPLESVGEFVPDQVLHIRSFSKSHGPDLRVAALGGPSDVVATIVRRRQLGPSWTSRLIQQILLTMLTTNDTNAAIAKAAETYALRRSTLSNQLAQLGVVVPPGVGLNMWVPVHDEQRAVVALAAHGVGVAPGGPFRVGEATQQHLRVSVGSLGDDPATIADVAATIANAAQPPDPHH